MTAPYSPFEHLALSICSNRGEGWRFVMADAHTVYVDDSGTDPKSRIATAAFCVSTVDKWLEFEQKWRKIAKHAKFDLKYFHMTEFAACRRDHLCQQCRSGKTSVEQHPWQKWDDEKRKSVLNRLAKAVVKYADCGFGIGHTKEDYETHVSKSPARAVANEPVGDEPFTFAIQQCGGALAEWRSKRGIDTPLRFVFDLSSDKQRYEIAKVFFAAAKDRTKYQGGIEQWFEPEPNGISFESRQSVVQLLSADMLAWTAATLRARQQFRKGRLEEVFQLADIFVASEHIKIGYTEKETLAKWEKDILNGSTPSAPTEN
jgi:hypothetical protein